MAHAPLVSLAPSLPVAAFGAAGGGFLWLCIALTLLHAGGRLSMPAVAVFGTLGAIGLVVLALWATVDGGQP